MILSRLSANLKGPWMIDPQSAEIMFPMLRSVLRGSSVSLEGSPVVSELVPVASRSRKGGSDKASEGNQVHILYLEGTMMRYDYCGSPGSKSLAALLRKADRNPDVIGHIISTDSGGGNAAAVPDLAEAIRSCTKPVVGFVDGTAASAAIYALSYCQKIISHDPMNMIGCVGTMIELSGFSKYRRSEDGEIYCRIYADQASEKNLDYEQALEGNATLIKENMLNPLCQQFITDMKTNRPGCADEQLHGKIYYAKDVIGSFIDSLGTLDDAVAAVVALASPAETEDFNRENMNNYKNLMAIACLAGLALAEDGSATLNPEQLEALDQALADAAASTRTLTSERDSLRETLTQRDNRISELETSLDAAISRANQETPEVTVTTNAPAAGEITGARTHEEAAAACAEFLKNFKNI